MLEHAISVETNVGARGLDAGHRFRFTRSEFDVLNPAFSPTPRRRDHDGGKALGALRSEVEQIDGPREPSSRSHADTRWESRTVE